MVHHPNWNCASSRKCQCTWMCSFVFMARLSEKFRLSSIVWYRCGTNTIAEFGTVRPKCRATNTNKQIYERTNELIKMERPFCVLHNASTSPVFWCLDGRLVTVKHKNHKCGNNRNQPNTRSYTFFLSLYLVVRFFSRLSMEKMNCVFMLIFSICNSLMASNEMENRTNFWFTFDLIHSHNCPFLGTWWIAIVFAHLHWVSGAYSNKSNKTIIYHIEYLKKMASFPQMKTIHRRTLLIN